VSAIRRARTRTRLAPRPRTTWQEAIGSVLALLGIAALFVLVFAPLSERFCSVHKIGCSLLTGFVSTALIALGGFFFLFVWTLRRSVKHYLDLAKQSPHRLFVAPPRIRAAEVVGRGRLERDVANEASFSRRGAPVVLVGEAGSGKTTFLLGLTKYLAESGAVPIPVSLRDIPPPLSLRSLAHEQFVQIIDAQVRSEGDAQRVWRKLSAEGRIVVLADGLDEFGADLARSQRDQALRSALIAAKNDQLSVVATSRPEAVPVGAPVSQFRLDPLGDEDAIGYLRSRVGRIGEADLATIREVVAVGEVTRRPFYLDVIASLYQAGKRLSVPDPPSRDRVHTELMQTWVDLLQKGKLLVGPELDPAEREAIIRGVALLGYVMTLRGVVDCTMEDVHLTLKELTDSGRLSVSLGMDDGRLIEGGGRLQLIDGVTRNQGTSVRFHHAITEAYFASRLLDEVKDAWKVLIEQTQTPEAMAALVMWCAAKQDQGTTGAVCDALIDRAATLDDDRGLALVVTAAQVAGTTGHGDVTAIAEATSRAWGRASSRGRLSAVRRLARRNVGWIYRILYEATRDRINYGVRWEAAQAIVYGGNDAYAELHDDFMKTVAYAESVPPGQWEDREGHDVAVLCWIAPALARAVSEPDSRELEEATRRLAALVERDMPLGTESSLAQGFKLAALTDPGGNISGVAFDLMKASRFWYTRIVLLHGMSVAALREPSPNKQVVSVIRGRMTDGSEHPFVREVARLCMKAIKTGDWTRFVWDDEGAMITQSGSLLADEAALLLADLVLLLNVTEQGITEDEVEGRKERTYRRNELPYCLGSSKDRSQQLFGSCHEACPFDLCPYPNTTAFRLARGEFSEAFCEHQTEILSARRRLVMRARRDRPGWRSASRRSATRRFWEDMNSRVR
jgi:NACHT domain-containing protein